MALIEKKLLPLRPGVAKFVVMIPFQFLYFYALANKKVDFYASSSACTVFALLIGWGHLPSISPSDQTAGTGPLPKGCVRPGGQTALRHDSREFIRIDVGWAPAAGKGRNHLVLVLPQHSIVGLIFPRSPARLIPTSTIR